MIGSLVDICRHYGILENLEMCAPTFIHSFPLFSLFALRFEIDAQFHTVSITEKESQSYQVNTFLISVFSFSHQTYSHFCSRNLQPSHNLGGKVFLQLHLFHDQLTTKAAAAAIETTSGCSAIFPSRYSKDEVRCFDPHTVPFELLEVPSIVV